jgi:hypothetical protein
VRVRAACALGCRKILGDLRALRALAPANLASETTARGLPMSGDRPKLVPSDASVGPATLPLPNSAVSTRAMVPLPERVGPKA